MGSTVMMFRQMGGVNLDVDATFLVQLAFIVLTMLVLRKLIFNHTFALRRFVMILQRRPLKELKRRVSAPKR